MLQNKQSWILYSKRDILFNFVSRVLLKTSSERVLLSENPGRCDGGGWPPSRLYILWVSEKSDFIYCQMYISLSEENKESGFWRSFFMIFFFLHTLNIFSYITFWTHLCLLNDVARFYGSHFLGNYKLTN